ncbi:MAG TPA: thioredoxin family protein [Methyloradius sp.]
MPIEGDLPSLNGASPWINSAPLTPESLRGKVVLIDFWTYSCINCLRSLPYVKAWYDKYKDHGLVVIGVHAPEFAFEKDEANVREQVKDLGITYPVVMDNQYSIWQAFNNQFWPAHYFIDAQGKIRGHHFGEGEYEESEQTIRQLLTAAGYKDLPAEMSGPAQVSGIQVASDEEHKQSSETYVGYKRAENFSSPGDFAEDKAKNYNVPAQLELNHWGLVGNWNVDPEKAVLGAASGKIIFKFYARDLHLVLGSGKNGKPIRFRVLIDGVAPGVDHGVDTDENGNGVINEQRLYQLVRQSKEVHVHTFTIEFLDAGAQAFAFTFG